MRLVIGGIAAGLALLGAVPAQSATVMLGGSTENINGSLTVTASDGSQLQLTGYVFGKNATSSTQYETNFNPLVVTSLSQMGTQALQQTVNGIGVQSAGEGSGSGAAQIDSIKQNEGLLVSFLGGAPGSTYNLLSVTLGLVSPTDNLAIYGVSGAGALTFIGWTGRTIADASTNGYTSSLVGTATYMLTFDVSVAAGLQPLGGYSRYLFTVADGNNDGFSLKGLNYQAVSPVPEPATWLMFLLGFGGIGFALRRRRRNVAAEQTAGRSGHAISGELQS